MDGIDTEIELLKQLAVAHKELAALKKEHEWMLVTANASVRDTWAARTLFAIALASLMREQNIMYFTFQYKEKDMRAFIIGGIVHVRCLEDGLDLNVAEEEPAASSESEQS